MTQTEEHALSVWRAEQGAKEQSEGKQPSRNIKVKVREINVRRARIQLHNVGKGRRHFGKVSVDWSLTDLRGVTCGCIG